MEQCGKDIWLYVLISRLLKQNHFHDTRPDCAKNTEGIRDYTWLPPFCLQALSIRFQDIGVNLQMTKLLQPGPLDLERKGCFIRPLKFQTVMLSILNLLSDPRDTNFLFPVSHFVKNLLVMSLLFDSWCLIILVILFFHSLIGRTCNDIKLCCFFCMSSHWKWHDGCKRKKKKKKNLSVWCQSCFPLFKLWSITSLLKHLEINLSYNRVYSGGVPTLCASQAVPFARSNHTIEGMYTRVEK